MSLEMSSLSILGIRVHVAHMSQVLDLMETWIWEKGSCKYIVATGMHGIMEARRHPEFKHIIESAALLVPDGYSLMKIARFRGFKINKRVSGPDLMWEACKRAEAQGYRVFFYGDTPETLQALTIKLKESFPNLLIAGFYSPPFRPLTEEEDRTIVSIINSAQADMLWVGLGLPKQEQWMYDHIDRLNVPVAVGVGAAFKFLSGRVKRAPAWIGNNGFEWLWRLAVEPRRVWRRVFIDGPQFMICIARESLNLARLPKSK